MTTITRKSGFLVYLDVDGLTYTVAATCALHGTIKTCAQLEREYKRSNQAVFGWVETRFRNDRRVQWGKASKR